MSRRTKAPTPAKVKAPKTATTSRKQFKKSETCTSRKCIFHNLPLHIHGPGVLDRLRTILRKSDLARQSHHLKRFIPQYHRRITQAVLFGVQNGRQS